MKPAACLGDMTTGHPPGFAPIPIMVGDPGVFIGGKAAATVGASVGPIHNFAAAVHPGQLAAGSSSVFIGGKAAARIGDKLACGDMIAAGNPGVMIGD